MPTPPPSELLQVSAFTVIYHEKECASVTVTASFLTQAQSALQSKPEQRRPVTPACPGSQGTSKWPGCHCSHLSSLENSKYPTRHSPQHHCQPCSKHPTGTKSRSLGDLQTSHLRKQQVNCMSMHCLSVCLFGRKKGEWRY